MKTKTLAIILIALFVANAIMFFVYINKTKPSGATSTTNCDSSNTPAGQVPCWMQGAKNIPQFPSCAPDQKQIGIFGPDKLRRDGRTLDQQTVKVSGAKKGTIIGYTGIGYYWTIGCNIGPGNDQGGDPSCDDTKETEEQVTVKVNGNVVGKTSDPDTDRNIPFKFDVNFNDGDNVVTLAHEPADNTTENGVFYLGIICADNTTQTTSSSSVATSSTISSCTNGATNPPICNICKTGFTYNANTKICVPNVSSSVTSSVKSSVAISSVAISSQTTTSSTAVNCTNGATNPPTCNTCGTNATYNVITKACETKASSSSVATSSTISSCTNGATNPPTCTLCSFGKNYDPTTKQCIIFPTATPEPTEKPTPTPVVIVKTITATPAPVIQYISPTPIYVTNTTIVNNIVVTATPKPANNGSLIGTGDIQQYPQQLPVAGNSWSIIGTVASIVAIIVAFTL